MVTEGMRQDVAELYFRLLGIEERADEPDLTTILAQSEQHLEAGDYPDEDAVPYCFIGPVDSYQARITLSRERNPGLAAAEHENPGLRVLADVGRLVEELTKVDPSVGAYVRAFVKRQYPAGAEILDTAR